MLDYFLLDYFLLDYFLLDYFLLDYFLLDYFLLDYFLLDYFLLDYFVLDYFLLEYSDAFYFGWGPVCTYWVYDGTSGDDCHCTWRGPQTRGRRSRAPVPAAWRRGSYAPPRSRAGVGKRTRGSRDSYATAWCWIAAELCRGSGSAWPQCRRCTRRTVGQRTWHGGLHHDKCKPATSFYCLIQFQNTNMVNIEITFKFIINN